MSTGRGAPPYVVHQVRESDVTIDWFFGRRRGVRARTRATQVVLVALGWLAAALPVAITASAVANRDDEESGWWDYAEGFALWDWTLAVLGLLLTFFAVAFAVLHLIDRRSPRSHGGRRAADDRRLARRLDLADAWYAEKFGPSAERTEVPRVTIQPYGDVETYELRGLYRRYGVDR